MKKATDTQCIGLLNWVQRWTPLCFLQNIAAENCSDPRPLQFHSAAMQCLGFKNPANRNSWFLFFLHCFSLFKKNEKGKHKREREREEFAEEVPGCSSIGSRPHRCPPSPSPSPSFPFPLLNLPRCLCFGRWMKARATNAHYIPLSFYQGVSCRPHDEPT